MAGKHTPGPWTHGHDGHGAFSIETDDCDGVQICYVRNEANARLIAAAPDLLDVLLAIQADQSWRTNDNSLWPRINEVVRRATQPLPPQSEEV